MAEKQLLNEIQLRCSRAGKRLFRNIVASSWAGESIRFDRISEFIAQPGDVLIRRAMRLQTGLVKGASDLIGWTPVKVTAEMVGRTLAVFTAIEVKTSTTRTTPEQEQFIAAVRNAGGKSAIVRTPAEAENL